jgi:hypothetical protein
MQLSPTAMGREKIMALLRLVIRHSATGTGLRVGTQPTKTLLPGIRG